MSATTPTATTNGAVPTGTAPTHAEAPASGTVRAVHAPSGYEWLLTCRADSVRDLVARVEYLTTWLADNGWTPAASRPAATTTATTGEPPTCPTHNTPMKRGRRGWFCPVKLLDDDGAGRAVYCRQTA